MTEDHEKHLLRLLTHTNYLMVKKYKAGAIEHGGYLPSKDGLIDEAINEAIDMLVYLLTLKDQLAQSSDVRDTL